MKQLRKEKKISQGELAKQLGISASTIGMYEQGRRDPDTQTLLKLAKALDVSVDYLVGVSDIVGHFDINETAQNVAENLINNPALMFSGDCYTDEELKDLCNIISDTVKETLSKQLKPSARLHQNETE